ncbi:MAG: hypothetical protein RLZZ293_735 [Pseudomonadota bacterium]|jgi:hypothetical protein
MKKQKFKQILLGCLGATIITGCTTVGLGNVPQTRENYNRALDTSENEQFLLNIIRLHYGDTPYFVSVDSITASTSLTVGGDGKIGASNVGAKNNGPLWSFSPQVSFTQTPTITYSPIQGSKFANGIIAPLTLDKVYMLLNSGYHLSEVLKLTMNKIGNLDNGTYSSHVNANKLPDSNKFDTFINSLSYLSDDNQVYTALTKYESKPAILIYANNSDAATTLSKQLGLSKIYDRIILTNTLQLDKPSPENIISVYPRSFFNMINFLSKSVDEPEDNKQLSVTNQDYNASLASNEIDWSKLTHGMLHVRTGKPVDPITRVKYNGDWYYISAQDSLSTSTLVLLKLIYSLQMGDVSANLPLITIPIAN